MAELTIDTTKKWTIEDYQQLEEDVRCEVINAELIMTPAPNTYHQLVLGELYMIFKSHSKKTNWGTTLLSPVDVYFDKENVFQPDLVFVLSENKDIIKPKGIFGAPDLLVEVISPSNSYMDRYVKKKKYEEFGVREFWIVDPANKTLEIFSLNEQNHYDMFLFLSEKGTVKSKVLRDIHFDLKDIF